MKANIHFEVGSVWEPKMTGEMNTKEKHKMMLEMTPQDDGRDQYARYYAQDDVHHDSQSVLES